MSKLFGLVSPQYSEDVWHPKKFKGLVHKLTRRLNRIIKENRNIQALAACGHSGLPVASVLSYNLGLPLIGVRKNCDGTHDHNQVNGYLDVPGYIIIDDLISSGQTVSNIMTSISAAAVNVGTEGPVCYGIVLYNSDGNTKSHPIEWAQTLPDENCLFNPIVQRRVTQIPIWRI
jgi:hypothetical protein